MMKTLNNKLLTAVSIIAVVGAAPAMADTRTDTGISVKTGVSAEVHDFAN